MIEVKSEGLGRSLETGRIIGEVGADSNGPLVIITAGLHGNEPGGVFAAYDLIDHLRYHEEDVRARIIAIAGNLESLKLNQRFIDVDLNRIWRQDNDGRHEFWEREQLYAAIEQATLGHQLGYKLHIDLHATSAPTMPFMVIKDSPVNREFAQEVPVPSVLGMEEVIKEPLLSLMCDNGFISVAFEGGIIGHQNTYRNHMAFMWAALAHSRALSAKLIGQGKYDLEALGRQTPFGNHLFHLVYAHLITKEDEFKMNMGFWNFQPVQRGDVLGKDKNGAVVSPETGHLFMPLYQEFGREGFFIVR